LLASACLAFYFVLINTPILKLQRSLQAREIENLKLQYSILNKKLDEIDEAADD
jgi:hypothetical protein